MTQFEDLLGNRWYIRGLNAVGDFCFVTPGTVRFYLREKKGRIDYQLKSDGTRNILEKVLSWCFHLFGVMAH